MKHQEACLQDLVAEVFDKHIGDAFTVSDGHSTWAMSLVEVSKGPHRRAGAREPFSLLFHGPLTSILPQAIYRFEHPAFAPMEIFIVPVGPAGDAMQYEAVFN
jgi:hypothetical protein